jgi:hypothetical protein
MVTKVVGYTKKALNLFGKLRSREIGDLLNSVSRHLKSFRRIPVGKSKNNSPKQLPKQIVVPTPNTPLLVHRSLEPHATP